MSQKLWREVPVSERLPEPYELYTVVSEGDLVERYLRSHNPDKPEWVYVNKNDGESSIEDYNVTAWLEPVPAEERMNESKEFSEWLTSETEYYFVKPENKWYSHPFAEGVEVTFEQIQQAFLDYKANKK